MFTLDLLVFSIHAKNSSHLRANLSLCIQAIRLFPFSIKMRSRSWSDVMKKNPTIQEVSSLSKKQIEPDWKAPGHLLYSMFVLSRFARILQGNLLQDMGDVELISILIFFL